MKSLTTLMSSLLLSTTALANSAILLGPNLEPTSVELQAISPTLIKVINAKGAEQSLKPEDVLRLTLTRAELPTPDAQRSVLTLRDGQIIVGRLVSSNDEESVRLKIDNDRQIQIPLDEVLSLAVQAEAVAPAATEDDALLLATGEVLLGFVETLTEDAIGFVVGDADDAIDIPLQRVKALSIANKPKPAEVEPGTLRVTMADGSLLLIQNAQLSSGDDGDALIGQSKLPILSSRGAEEGDSTAAASRVALPMGRIMTIEPLSTKASLMSLFDAAFEVQYGGEVFGVAMPPTVKADGAIALHAPVTIGFELPKGATRLALSVAMDLDDAIPASRRKMAGCELLVYVGQRVVARHALTADGPPKRLNLPLTGGNLRLALDAGVNGPVLDRVVVTEAELLVSE